MQEHATAVQAQVHAVFEPADGFATARVALPTATDAATAPLDRHPACLAVPVFLEGYGIEKTSGAGDDALAFTVAGHPLAVDTDRMPTAGPLTPAAVAASGACIGLMRWDAGAFRVQPLAVETTVRKKTVVLHAGGWAGGTPGRRLGVDRRGTLGQERRTHPRPALPPGWPGRHQEADPTPEDPGRPGARPARRPRHPRRQAHRLPPATPPVLDRLDEAELLGWSVEIVRAARRNGYLASTADAIAVFETSILLAGMRDRAKPTPYDFQDAAVTCIEKDTVPGRRDVRRLVDIMMGGDRTGQVGYDALPPLARDVHDRLAPLGRKLQQRGVQRALLDVVARPELERCSDVLWMLRFLMPHGAARPIMGERRLGERPLQESWDLALGTHQRALIELGYEGVSVEQVLEQRLRRTGYAPQATAATVLEAVEDAALYLRSRGLADELGTRALEVLAAERDVDGAPEVLRRVRRLLAHYRTSEPVLSPWIESSSRPGTRTTAPCCRRPSPTTTPPSATSRPCWASCSAWRAWRSPWAATGPNWSWRSTSHTPRTRRRRPCCGRPAPNSATSPAPTCGRGATPCSATRWWCPPTRATSAASCTPWSRSRASRTSWWKRCRTPSPGCPTRCPCRGCRP